MEWGKHEARLHDLEAKGLDAPALERKPDITGLEWIWEAFFRLSTCRQMGMGAGPIPWTAIDRYCVRERLSWEESEHLEYCIFAMDKVFQDHQESKTKDHANRTQSNRTAN